MNAVKIIGYILAGIFIVFGVLFILAAFGEVFNSGWLITGIIMVLIGFGVIAGTYFLTKRQAEGEAAGVTLNIDLPADVNLDSFTCQNCGGALTTDNIKMVAGAPVVTCPYCGTTYQLTEEPKW
jgi:Na+/melibiose symporter-like transporter